MLLVALDLRVGKLRQSHVACRSCSLEPYWASSLHFLVDTDTCGFSLEETLDESYLQGLGPWMQLLEVQSPTLEVLAISSLVVFSR